MAVRLTNIDDLYFLYNNYLGRDPVWGVEVGVPNDARLAMPYDQVVNDISNSEEAKLVSGAGWKPPKDPYTGLPWAQKTTAPKPAPTPTTPKTRLPPNIGITNGQYEDYKAMVQSALKSLGFDSLANDWFTMDPATDTDKLDRLVGMVKSGFDMEAIVNSFRNDQALVAINPGLPYGLSREDYYRQRAAMETSFGSYFGDPATRDQVKGKQNDPTAGGTPPEAEWESAVFHEKLSPQESAQMFGDYFKRLGRAPSVSDIGRYANRAQQQYSDNAIMPSFTKTDVGPTASSLAGPSKNIGNSR